MIWLWAWPAIGFLTGLYLVFSKKGGGRVDLRADGAATDTGWLIILTVLGPIPAILIVCLYLNLFFGCRE